MGIWAMSHNGFGRGIIFYYIFQIGTQWATYSLSILVIFLSVALPGGNHLHNFHLF